MRNLVRPEKTQERAAYYDAIAGQNLFPLWERLADLLSPEPRVRSRPHAWKYKDVRPALMQAAGIISAEEAERRVLILENPGLIGSSAITESLYAGLQLITPGEIAPAHRHSPSALRFLLEGTGAYTAVGGEKAWMEHGDLVLTPSMQWHDHGHEGQDPVVWLDVLDLPLLTNLGAIFLDGFGDRRYPETRPAASSEALYGSNMRPIGYENPSKNSPLIKYSYARSRGALEAMSRAADPDPILGYGLEYVDPLTGRSALSTISTFLQFLPKGFLGQEQRVTDGRIFSIAEGFGQVDVGEGEHKKTFSYAPRDTIVAPCWAPVSWRSQSDTFVFTASDRNVQQLLGVWRAKQQVEADA